MDGAQNPGIGIQHPVHGLEHGGFAAAGGADDGRDPIGGNGGIDLGQNGFLPIGNAEIVQRDDGILHFFLLHANQVARVLVTSTTIIITKAVP